jgi:hypothetical protein
MSDGPVMWLVRNLGAFERLRTMVTFGDYVVCVISIVVVPVFVP